jgi:hypothetical protein
MSIRNILFATAFALASLGAARADGLRPVEAKSIDLGEVSGVAYYTIPTALCSQRPTPMCGAAHQATRTLSRPVPTALPTLTSLSCAMAKISRGGYSASY